MSEIAGGVKFISLHTLGIYLIHMWILVQTYTRVERFFSNPFLLIPIVCGLAFFAGFCFTIVVRQIPYFGKYLV